MMLQMCYFLLDVEFKLMKLGVILVNIGWGLIVDNVVFYCVLIEGDLVVVGLDDLEEEFVKWVCWDLVDNLLFSLFNVMVILYVVYYLEELILVV